MKNKLYITLLLIFIFSCPTYGQLKKKWELKTSEMFIQDNYKTKKGRLRPPEGGFHPLFTPAVIKNKIIVASEFGTIKEIHAKSKKITKLAKLPINIETGALHGWNNILYKGKHKRNDKYYLTSIDLKAKKLRGLIKSVGPVWQIKDFSMFCKGNNLHLISPVQGRVVYTQKIDFPFTRQVKCAKKKQFAFFNANNDLIELVLPDWAIALLFATTKPQKGERKKAIFNFRKVNQLKESLVPIYLKNHKEVFFLNNDILGLYNFKKEKIIWEYNFDSAYGNVSPPIETKYNLVFLISKEIKKNLNEGKLIAINLEKGNLMWETEPFTYANYAPVEFDNMIMGQDNERNLNLINIKTGKVKNSYKIGEMFTTPIKEDDSLYVLSKSKLTRFVEK
jgi:hypothetical protein